MKGRRNEERTERRNEEGTRHRIEEMKGLRNEEMKGRMKEGRKVEEKNENIIQKIKKCIENTKKNWINEKIKKLKEGRKQNEDAQRKTIKQRMENSGRKKKETTIKIKIKKE